MSTRRLPVDLLNPGQVFACLGLIELTEILVGPCESAFLSEGRQTNAMFELSGPGDVDPVRLAVEFVKEADVCAIAPLGSQLAAKEEGIVTERMTDPFFPSSAPRTPSALPVRPSCHAVTAG